MGLIREVKGHSSCVDDELPDSQSKGSAIARTRPNNNKTYIKLYLL